MLGKGDKVTSKFEKDMTVVDILYDKALCQFCHDGKIIERVFEVKDLETKKKEETFI